MQSSIARVISLTAAATVACATFSSCAADGVTQSIPSIGAATMLADGTINLQLRAEIDSAVGDTMIQIKPSEPRYQDIITHVGGLKPGEEKPVPPWRVSK